MWVVHLTLTLAALYAVIITGMYFAQTWLLFPTVLAGAARVQLPASTQRLEVETPNRESLAGVRIPSQGERAEGAPTLLGFGGNAWNAEATALTLHALFPHRDVVAFHYRGYAPSTGRPSAQALFSDSLIIFDHLLRTKAGERIIPVGFSIGAAVAAYLARTIDAGHNDLYDRPDFAAAAREALEHQVPDCRAQRRAAPLGHNRVALRYDQGGGRMRTADELDRGHAIAKERRDRSPPVQITGHGLERVERSDQDQPRNRRLRAYATTPIIGRSQGLSWFRIKSPVNRARDSSRWRS